MAYPVSLAELKVHLRIDASYNTDDDYLEDIIIPTSVEYCRNFIDSSTLLITDASCAYPIKQAILICAGDFYDVERSSYTIGSIKRGDVIQRLLMPYKITVW